MIPKRVLITGGGGFAGSHLAEGYVRLGHEVTVLDTAVDAATRRRLACAAVAETELDADALDRLGPGFDLVVHGAAVTTARDRCGQTDAAQIRTNLDLLLVTFDYAVRSRAGAFVFLSSSGVFAARDAAERLLEATVPSGRSAYALAKRLGEAIVGEIETGPARRLTARLGYLYGPHEAPRPTRTRVSLVRQWLDRARAGQPIIVPIPEAQRDWTFAPDLAPALEAALAHPEQPQLVHLGCGAATGDTELAARIADLHPGARIDRTPAAEPVKASMASQYDLATPWTSLGEGLRLTLAAEHAA